MPVDPEISLNVTGGRTGMMQPGGSAPTPNPLEMAAKLIDVRNAQAQFQAKKLAGQIIAASPDMDSAIAEIQKNPQTAAFAPEIVQSVASTRGTVLDNMGKIQSQGHDAFSNFVKQFPAVIQDRSQFGALKKTSLDLASPAIRPQLEKSFNNLEEAITSGLPDDPGKAQEQMLQRFTGWAYANGAGDAIPHILGQPAQIDTGPKIQAGVVAPPQGGPSGQAPGAFTPGNSLTKGIAPQLTGAEAVPYGGGGSGGANPLTLPAPKGGQQGQPTPATAATPIAQDGTPLVPKDYSIPTPKNPSIGQVPIGETSKNLAHVWATTGLHTYNNAVGSLGQLDELDRNLDNMARHGGAMVPGSLAGLRLSAGKTLNTIAQIVGAETPEDAGKIASGEDILKGTHRLAGTLLATMYGQQREAAETIKNVTENGVPGIENSYLGGKLLTASIRAAAERQIDQRNFENWWQQKRGGDLTGADEEFNRLNPATTYVGKVLDRFGLDADGFKSLADLESAVREGYMTPKQAAQQAKKQKFDLPGAK